MYNMKALVKEKPESGLWLKDVPTPKVGINDVLIKIYKTAICGTDVHIYNWNEWAQKTIPVPIEEIARDVDITDIRSLEIDGFEGGLVAFDDKVDGPEERPLYRRYLHVGEAVLQGKAVDGGRLFVQGAPKARAFRYRTTGGQG